MLLGKAEQVRGWRTVIDVVEMLHEEATRTNDPAMSEEQPGGQCDEAGGEAIEVGPTGWGKAKFQASQELSEGFAQGAGTVLFLFSMGHACCCVEWRLGRRQGNPSGGYCIAEMKGDSGSGPGRGSLVKRAAYSRYSLKTELV